MQRCKTAGFALPEGDEFALDEYTDLASIQFSETPDQTQGGISTRHGHFQGSALERHHFQESASTADTPTSSSETREPVMSSGDMLNIEVFDDARHLIDIYSISDSDKERLLLQDFDGDRALALQFVELIKQAAIIRTSFKVHSNPEIMARQLVMIGQDQRLFESAIIVPLVQYVSTETFLDRLRKSNLQQIIRGRVVRVRRQKKPAQVPEINISRATTATPSTKTMRDKASGIQFSQSTRAQIQIAQTSTSSSVETMVPANMSVIIQELAIQTAGVYPIYHGIPYLARAPGESEYTGSPLAFDCIGSQSERPPWAYDTSDIPHKLAIDSAEENFYLNVFLYLRLLFQQFFFARPVGYISPSRANEDFASAPTDMSAEDAPDQTLPVVEGNDAVIDRLIPVAKILGIALDFTNPTNIPVDFQAQSALAEYWKLRYSSVNPEEIAEPLRAVIKAKLLVTQESHKYRAKINRLEVLARLIEENYGSAKLVSESAKNVVKREVPGSMGPDIGLIQTTFTIANSEDELFANLTKAERAFILAKYENLYLSAPVLIACEHISIVRMLRTAVNARAVSRHLARLSPLLATSKSEGLVKCSLCGQDAICPHVLDLSRVIAEQGPQSREREVLAQYIMRIPGRQTHYCRICGEYFAWTSLILADDVEKADPEDPEISAEIYHELMILHRYVRAQNVIDQISFIRMVARHIYPFIEVIESKTAIAQTSIASEFSAKMRIFIMIYAFADCIINMKQFGVIFEGFQPTDRIEASAVKYAINKIMIIENVALNAVPSITREVISTNLVTAIGHLRDVASDMPFDAPPRDYRASIMYDPVFSIFSAYCELKRTPSARQKETKKTKSKAGQKKSHSGQKKSRVPIEAAEHIANPKDPFDFRYNVFHLLDAKPQNPRNIYEPLIAQCPQGKHSHDFTSTKEVIRAIITNLATMINLRAFDFPIDTNNRAVLDLRQAIRMTNEKIRATEDLKIRVHMSDRRIPLSVIIRDRAALREQESYRPGPLSDVYDEDGKPHRWDILIFAQDKSGSEPALKVEIKLGSKDAFADPALKYVDKKCSVCNILQSKVPTLNEATIREALLAREQLENFYQFFETRCPVEGAHEFDAPSQTGVMTCVKCQYTSQKASALDREYFNKYVSVFRANMAPSAPIPALPGKRISARDIAINKAAQEYASQPWTFNYEAIVNAAALFKVERHDLQVLGAREGLTREQLSDESFVARIPKTRVDIRIQALRSYISEIFTMYNIIKNTNAHEKIRVHSIAQFIEDLRRKLSSSITSIAQFETITASMAPLSTLLATESHEPSSHGTGAPFDLVLLRALDIFAELHKPAEIIDYYLEMLCTILQTIASSKVAPHICSVFAHSMITRILARENITIKGERFNLSVVEGTKLASDEFESAGATTVFDELEDPEIEENVIDEDLKEEADPFSLDAFDMDDTLVEETTDPDDTQTLIHIGDEVGW